MAPPNPIKCDQCDFTTAVGLPTYDLIMRHLEQHGRVAHPQGYAGQAGAGQGQGGGGGKQEKLPRPALDTGITEADWTFFESQWKRYKRSTRLLGQDAIDQLWACASEELGRQCHDAGVTEDTTEEELLAMFKRCSIRAQNKLVNVVEFLNLSQEPEEAASKFISRVKGQAKVCEFKVTCTAEECGQEVSYSDKLCSHVIVRGLEDSDIQERVLALAATEQELDLKRVTEFIYAQETGRESRKILSGAGALNKMSQYQQDKRGRSNTMPGNSDKPSKDKCYYCGNTGHGHKSSAEVRKNSCPAFDKKCIKCKMTGHFARQCKKKGPQNAALQDRGSVSDSGELDGFGFYAMTVPSTKPRHRARGHLRKLSHYAVDMFGKWAARRPEPQPSVTVSVSVSQSGYRQIHVPAPRKTRTVTCPALPDTGAQMVVAGMDLPHRLGYTKRDLFPVTSGIKAANSEGLKLLGGILITVSAEGSDGITRSTSHMCYISESVSRLFLSKAACRGLGMIPDNFPEVGSCDNIHSVNKCELVDESDSCGCPERKQTPDPPAQLPCPATEENIPKLKEYIIQHYKDSAFNCCEQQQLPLMKEAPPMQLFADKNAKPVAFHKAFPIPLHWQAAVKKQLDNDVKMGVLAKVPLGTPTEWCSRMVVIAKKDPSKPRRTVDFQNLNKVCARQTHAGKSPFHQAVSVPPNSWKTCLDAKDGYHSIPLHPDDQPLTTFVTQWGKYYYKVMPQGFVASQDGYNSRYDEIIQDFENKERCVDDTILWDKFGDNSIENNFWRTCHYVSRCGKAGILFSEKKFQFCQKEVEFIGFRLDERGVKPTSEFLSSIRDFPVPKDITGIRSWFGLVEQCTYAFSKTDTMGPFRHLLKPEAAFIWDEDLQRAFEHSKEEIIRQVERGIETFDTSKQTCLLTDWSKTGIGFKLMQKNCDCEPLAPHCCPEGWGLVFANGRFLTPAESRYSSVEGECLGAAWAMEKCKYFLLGCESFLLGTDHKPLLGILSDRNMEDVENPRLQRLKEKTLRYRFSICHVPGKLNKVADAASRFPTSQPEEGDTLGQLGVILAEPTEQEVKQSLEIEQKVSGLSEAAVYGLYMADKPRPANILALQAQVITWQEVQQRSSEDKDLQELLTLLQEGAPEDREQWPVNLRPFFPVRSDLTVQSPVVLYKERVVIPRSLRPEVLETLHSGNGGVTSMTARAGVSVWWPGITADIEKQRQNCSSCDRVAPSQPAAPPSQLPSPDYPFQQICSDFMSYGGHNYGIMVDRFSSWISVYKVPNVSSDQVIRMLRHQFETFGASEELASDGGLGYMAAATQSFLKQWGCRHRVSSAYFPHSNLRAEQGVKLAKQLIRDNTDKSGSLDNDRFARALLNYRNTPLRDIGRSPAQIVTGRQLRDHLPANPSSYRPSREWLVTKEQREIALAKKYAKQEEVWAEHTKTLPELPVGSVVRVQNQTGNKPKRWDRTGLIVEVLPHLQYKVRMDGSGDISLRNRRFLRKITPIQSIIQSPTTAPPRSRSEAASPPEPRRSSRVSKKTQRFSN